MTGEHSTLGRPLRFLIAASGTGGHLYPALNIAKAIKRALPDAEVEFIGSGKSLEGTIIDNAGFKRHVIKLSGVQGTGISGKIKFLSFLPGALIKTVRLLRRFKPDVIIGVGGYVSVLPVALARRMGIKTCIHEAEMHPGLANKFLGYLADKATLTFPTTKLPGGVKSICTGHPIRVELQNVDRGKGMSSSPKHLLVIGGSQGARGIDLVMPKIAKDLAERGVEVWHQGRSENLPDVLSAYQTAGVTARTIPFITDMIGAYNWADVIVSRSGAGSVQEIGAVNRPALFVPYPFQQGTHQTENAMTLVNAGKALIVEEGEGFEVRFREALLQLLNPEQFHKMKRTHFESGALSAADRIAKECIELARGE